MTPEELYAEQQRLTRENTPETPQAMAEYLAVFVRKFTEQVKPMLELKISDLELNEEDLSVFALAGACFAELSEIAGRVAQQFLGASGYR